jgi:long-chain acyl-CoA synthetase
MQTVTSELDQHIGAAFLHTAQARPDKSALVFLGTHYPYNRLRRWVLAFSHGLEQLGVQAGDRLILYLPNGPQWVIAWLGVLVRGAVAVPITPIYTTHDLRYIANDSGARAIVCTDVNCGYVTEVLPETGIQWIVHTNLADCLPAWKRFFGLLANRVPRGKISREGFAVPFRKLLHAGPPLAGEAQLAGADLAEILYTGGTTKHVKGVPITHRLFLASADVQLRVAESLIPRGKNVVLQGAPLFHILGQVFGMGPLCLTGDTVVLLPRANLDGMMNAIQQHGARSIFAVPALYRMILEHDRVDLYDMGSLRYCFSGGDVLPIEIARRWRERFGVPIYQGYGATETVGGISLSPTDRENPPGSMGRVLPHKEIRVVDDDLQDLETGGPGELLVHSDPMVEAYWNKPEETSGAFVTRNGHLWYRTGDIVRTDEQGYLYFVDRTADTIKHKGYRVSASEIEAVLQEHPAVVSTCVVGQPDPKVGERIKAFVVLREDIKGMTGYDLIKWCRERLASYKIPHYIEFRDTLPKSKVGKLLRREVRADEQKRLEKGKWHEAIKE